ncbi:MAG: hypothetical protein VX681_10530, partial [Myxococcota bacterium]|nr:hypothetical protein [Myxococcota bacterium]
MLRRALGICTASLLLLVTQAFARDSAPEDVLLGPAQEDTGPDYARDGYYLQIGYSWGKASKLADKLNRNREKFALEPQESDKIKKERLVPFRQFGSEADENRSRTSIQDVNPRADAPCITTVCPISPLNDIRTFPDDGPPQGIFIPAVPLAALLQAQNGDPSSPDLSLQIGGTVRVQPIPGLRPGFETAFLKEELNTVVNGLQAQQIDLPFDTNPGPPNQNIIRPGQACGHASRQSVLETYCLTVMNTLGEALGTASVGNSQGLNVRAGNRVLPNLAIELQLEYMSGFEVDIPNYSQPGVVTVPPFLTSGGGRFVDDTVTYLSASDTDKINVELLVLTVNLKVPILTGRIQPYGLLGGGVVFAFRDN